MSRKARQRIGRMVDHMIKGAGDREDANSEESRSVNQSSLHQPDLRPDINRPDSNAPGGEKPKHGPDPEKPGGRY